MALTGNQERFIPQDLINKNWMPLLKWDWLMLTDKVFDCTCCVYGEVVDGYVNTEGVKSVTILWRKTETDSFRWTHYTAPTDWQWVDPSPNLRTITTCPCGKCYGVQTCQE